MGASLCWPATAAGEPGSRSLSIVLPPPAAAAALPRAPGGVELTWSTVLTVDYAGAALPVQPMGMYAQ
jgi:hypothetical protein